MRKLIIGALISLGALVPALVLAQTSTTGLLTVYVQVNTQSGYSGFQTYVPGNFTVSVSGNSPSVTTFQGSQSGTPVQLFPGNYNVTVGGLTGYTPSYSVGCNNTISAGQSQTCVITMNPTYGYYGTAYPYNYNANPYNYYPYGVAPLSCRANVPSVAVGQPVTFTATGGAGGTYNWVAPYTQSLNYPSAGTQLTVTFEAQGQQSVQVTNAAQTASCSVLVTQGYYPYSYSTYPYNNYAYNNGSYYTTPSNYYTAPATTQTYYPGYYPNLPHTGFGPKDNALGYALSAVLLIAAGLMLAPYARKALAITGR